MGRRGRFTISGSVRDLEANRPLEGVEVQLWSVNGGLVSTTYTNGGGSFGFIDLPAGNYYLQIQEDGYEQLREEVSSSGRPSMGLQLALRPRFSREDKVAPASPTVSVRQLSIPRPAREAMERGQALIQQKNDYKGSLAQFQRAIKEYPQYYEAYSQMGLAYMMLGDPDKAEQALRTSVDLSQRKYPDALILLASLYSNLQRFGAAEMAAREAVELNPNSLQANQEWARSLHALGRDQEAEAAALKARDADPSSPQTYLLLANIHLRTRNYPQLIKDLDTFLQLAPNAPEANQARQMREQVLQRVPALRPGSQP